MDAQAVVDLFAVGAALLALWCVVRFPNVGPRTLGSGVAVLALGLLLMVVAQTLIRPVGSAAGPAVALLLVVLPALTAVFWAAASFFRLLLALRY